MEYTFHFQFFYTDSLLSIEMDETNFLQVK